MARAAGFRSEHARAAYVAAYDAVLAASIVSFEELDLDSRFGRTHVLQAGAPGGAPIVFLHGKAMSSTMWVDTVPPFLGDHRVHLVDIVGDMNKSRSTVTMRTAEDVVEWLDATLDSLAIERGALVGLSYGAWIATAYAMARPQRVERLAVLSPPAIFSPVRPAWMAKALYAHVVRPRRDVAKRFIESTLMPATVAGLPDDPQHLVIDQYLVGVPGFRSSIWDAPPKVYKADALASLTMPTLVMIGEEETLNDGPMAARRARERLPAAEVVLVPGSNHGMTTDRPAIVADRLRALLRGSS